MENVVVSIFPVESEAFQAFTELRQKPYGEDYEAVEAVLFKNRDGITIVEDCYAVKPLDAGETKGLVIGSLVGVLGGPLGVLLGASYGAIVGGAADTAKAADMLTGIEVLAGKVYEGETAIVALVKEEEPAFDAAFEKFEKTTIRYDAADIMAEVDRAYEIQADMNRQALAQLREDRKAGWEERREARRADLKAKFEEYEAATNRSMGFE